MLHRCGVRSSGGSIMGHGIASRHVAVIRNVPLFNVLIYVERLIVSYRD